MNKSSESQVNLGRPYGGTGFLYNKTYSKCLRPLLNYSHERVTVMELCTESCKIIVINAYMPYFNSRDLATYLTMYRETLGYIENVMSQHIDCQFIILSDFNCNISDMTKLVRNLMTDYSLVSSFDLISNFDWENSFTRYDKKTNSHTLIDGILVSRGLVSLIDNVRISNYGGNVSDHLPVEMDLHVVVTKMETFKKTPVPYINWSKLSVDAISVFRQKRTENLDEIFPSNDNVLHGNQLCHDDCHKLDLENYYNAIVDAVVNAESFLPRVKPGLQRSYWSSDLDTLKTQSIECTEYWKRMGSPRTGPVFDCKRDCSLKYKTAIRKQKASFEKKNIDDMHTNLLERDSNSFWIRWNSLNRKGSSIVSRINGETDEKNIADVFATHFETVYGGHDSPEHVKLKDNFFESFSQYRADHIEDDLSSHYLSWQDMVSIASKIKVGKATSGVIRPEHFLQGSPDLLQHFLILFTGMIQHGFVPTEFLKSTVSPIIKDSQGDLSETKNYRGISLGSLPSKLFEYAIQLKTSHLLGTDHLQFGFKQKTGTNHALYTLESTVNYFNRNGSNVYVSFLDCTKAFDRISHYGLFSKLMLRGFPLCFLLCLMFWYQNMIAVVKWGSEVSREFRVPLGIKQGGINSPDFFSVYFDDLMIILRKKGIGCHIGKLFLASIFFADDICLIAPTRSALQELMTCCSEYCKSFALEFNPKKSKIMIFSKSRTNLETLQPIVLNGTNVDYVQSIKYLGVTICSRPSFSYSAETDLRSFYRAVNSILNVINGPNEVIKMHLLFTNCVPILTYACAAKEFPAREMTSCNTALNDAIRKIFSFHRWESVRTLREGFGYKSLIELFANAKRKFLLSLPAHQNPIFRSLPTLNSL